MDGLTALGIIVFNILFGLISILHGKKKNANLLVVVGYVSILVGCFWLGPSVDFFMVLFTQKNISPDYLYAILSYIWIAPSVIATMYLGAELLAPDKKRIIVIIYAIVGIIFEYFLLFQTKTSFIIVPPATEGDLLDTSFNSAYPAFFIIAFLLGSVLVFLVFGNIIKAKQSSGEIRRKFIYITIGFAIFLIVGIADSLFPIGPLIGIFRVIMMTFSLWLYLGLKP